MYGDVSGEVEGSDLNSCTRAVNLSFSEDHGIHGIGAAAGEVTILEDIAGGTPLFRSAIARNDNVEMRIRPSPTMNFEGNPDGGNSTSSSGP